MSSLHTYKRAYGWNEQNNENQKQFKGWLPRYTRNLDGSEQEMKGYDSPEGLWLCLRVVTFMKGCVIYIGLWLFERFCLFQSVEGSWPFGRLSLFQSVVIIIKGCLLLKCCDINILLAINRVTLCHFSTSSSFFFAYISCKIKLIDCACMCDSLLSFRLCWKY